MVTDALRNLFEWFTTQTESTQAAATAGTARSYCQFKEKTRELVTLLKPLNQAYKNAENEGRVVLSLAETKTQEADLQGAKARF